MVGIVVRKRGRRRSRDHLDGDQVNTYSLSNVILLNLHCRAESCVGSWGQEEETI